MMTKFLNTTLCAAAALSAIGLAATASAQPVRQESPQMGESRIAAIGDEMWSLRRFDGVPGIITQAPVYAEWSQSKVVNTASGTEFVIIREDSLKACRSRTYTHFSYSIIDVEFKGWDDCLIDKDGDGAFELVTYKKLGSSKKLEPQVPYARAQVPRQADNAIAVRESVLYLGSSKDTIQLGYRQFFNEVPQPAYSEQAVIARPTKFPHTVMIRDRKLTLLGLSNQGLSYRIDP